MGGNKDLDSMAPTVCFPNRVEQARSYTPETERQSTRVAGRDCLKALRLLYVSLNSRLESNREEEEEGGWVGGRSRGAVFEAHNLKALPAHG